MGCAGSKGGPTYETEESRKDAAANALQLAATAHLRKKASTENAKKNAAEDPAAKAKREAEAAALLQRTASAHLALAEPNKPPGLNIPTEGPAIIANVIESARGVATALTNIFSGSEQQPGAAASGSGVRPPSIAIPAPGTADSATQSGDNLFTQALNSARAVFGAGPAEPTASAAEELAAKLEAEEAAAAADKAGAPSAASPSPTAATSTAPAAAAVATEVATAETSAAQSPPSPEPEPDINLGEVSHPDAFRPSLPTPDVSPKAVTPSKPTSTPSAEVSQVL